MQLNKSHLSIGRVKWLIRSIPILFTWAELKLILHSSSHHKHAMQWLERRVDQKALRGGSIILKLAETLANASSISPKQNMPCSVWNSGLDENLDCNI